MTEQRLLKYTAFTTDPAGGNPAGVWIGEAWPGADEMQRIAAELGFSETAFIAPASGRHRKVRYFSPAAEVPFCGHATIATAIALAGDEGDGLFTLDTPAGRVPVSVATRGGQRLASLTSVEPRYEPAPASLVTGVLAALAWSGDELDPRLPPARAYAGAWHLVLAAASRERLAALEYDFAALESLMRADGLTTVQLVYRQDDSVFHSRNPFPVGGVVEDPATGAAAAALGAYLRDARLLRAPATIRIHQGDDMGRPSVLEVAIPASGGIVVSGTAVPI